MNDEPVSTRSSGNPFADLGVADPDAQLAKAKLAVKINTIMRERHLNQSQLAQQLGIDQPRVSRIIRGQLREVSLERLLEFVRLLNQDVEIVVREKVEPTPSECEESASASAPARANWSKVATDTAYPITPIAASGVGVLKVTFN